MRALPGARVLRRWVDLVAGLGSSDFAGRPSALGPPHHEYLDGELFLVELPVLLARQFPELAPCVELGLIGRRAAERALQEVVSFEGLPHATQWDLMRPLLACWTRAWTLIADLSATAKTKDIPPLPPLFVDFLTTNLRLLRPDGSQMLGRAGTESAWPLLAAAVRLTQAAQNCAEDVDYDGVNAAWRLSAKGSTAAGGVPRAAVPPPAQCITKRPPQPCCAAGGGRPTSVWLAILRPRSRALSWAAAS